jgi:hypothetical protein
MQIIAFGGFAQRQPRLAARGQASDAAGLALPETCPYRLEDVLAEDWWPEATTRPGGRRPAD